MKNVWYLFPNGVGCSLPDYKEMIARRGLKLWEFTSNHRLIYNLKGDDEDYPCLGVEYRRGEQFFPDVVTKSVILHSKEEKDRFMVGK